MDKNRNKRTVKEGIVLSDKMDKTIVVKVNRLVKHKKYGRVIRRATKLKVHDEEKKAKTGNKVLIMETRPLSKEKKWRLLEVIK